MYALVALLHTGKSLDRVFHYALESHINTNELIGTRVLVPFGNSKKTFEGVVVGLTDTLDFPPEKLKPIKAVMGERLLTKELLTLADIIKERYFSSLSECLRCMFPAGLSGKDDLLLKKRQAVLCAETYGLRLTAAQKAVIDALKDGPKLIVELKESLSVSDSPINSLEKKGIIKLENVNVKREVIRNISQSTNTRILTQAQQNALNSILTSDKPSLLYGVTGSGKTEVYLNLIEHSLSKGKQAIMLVPEISLTPQTVRVFTERFGKNVSVTHSRMSAGERYEQWKRAKDGEISILIGPRSAIFAPFPNLGIIIIDEEHETSYKSETSPKYHTKAVALERSKLTGARLVLGSATPSAESFYEAKNGLFNLVTMSQRINKTMPTVEIVDMRVEFDHSTVTVFSEALKNAMYENLQRREATILFLNRRGYSNFVSCRRCGEVLKCPNCAVSYTEHRTSESILICHYCGKTLKTPKNCPICGSENIRNFGLGTQKVEEETRRLFPDARILRMDADTTSGKHGHERILNEFGNGNADILIGTQMIAKGLDFPNVTLVGIVAADMSLCASDFRAAENTFRLLTQVSGRAGRSERSGRVFIQTYNPSHYALTFAKQADYDGFFDTEIALRRQCNYPPFSHIFTVMMSIDASKEEQAEKRLITVISTLYRIMEYCNKSQAFDILPPSPSIIPKLNNNYRWRLAVKCADEDRLKRFGIYCVNKLKEKVNLQNITTSLNIDPISMEM